MARSLVHIYDIHSMKGRREGKRWLVKVRDTRKRAYVTKAFDDRQQGKLWADETLAKFRLGLASAGKAPLAAIGDEYIEHLNRRDPPCHPNVVRVMQRVIDSLVAAGITDMKAQRFRAQVETWYENLSTEAEWSKSTTGRMAVSSRNQLMKKARALIGYAIRKQHIDRNPLIGIELAKEADTPRPTFAIDEMRRIVALDLPEDFAWVWTIIMLYSGARRMEAAMLDLATDFDWQGRIIQIRKGKGSKARAIPMLDEFHDFFSPVFGPTAEKPMIGRLIDRMPDHDAQWWDEFRRILKAADIDPERGADAITGMPVRLSPHSCRHSYAALQLATGTDSLWLKLALGHSEMDMTSHYARQTVSYQRQVRQEGWPRGQFRLRACADVAAEVS